ncbi:hypothetical protein ACT453_47625, partial [Bacillus sp. D-CC]
TDFRDRYMNTTKHISNSVSYFIKEPIASVVRMAIDIGEAAMKIKDKLINPIKDAWRGIMGWIDKIRNGIANMFSGIHIPVPKISVNGSLNPTK